MTRSHLASQEPTGFSERFRFYHALRVTDPRSGETVSGCTPPKRSRHIALAAFGGAAQFYRQINFTMNSISPAIGLIVLILLVIAALWVFIKIEHFIFKMAGGFIGLVAIAAGVWWFFLRR